MRKNIFIFLDFLMILFYGKLIYSDVIIPIKEY